MVLLRKLVAGSAQIVRVVDSVEVFALRTDVGLLCRGLVLTGTKIVVQCAEGEGHQRVLYDLRGRDLFALYISQRTKRLLRSDAASRERSGGNPGKRRVRKSVSGKSRFLKDVRPDLADRASGKPAGCSFCACRQYRFAVCGRCNPGQRAVCRRSGPLKRS